MKKYYQLYGDKTAVFAMDANLSIEQVCKIFKVKKVKEISFGEFYYAHERFNYKYFLAKLRRKSKLGKERKLTYKQ